ncbi:MAG: hypothetical protein FWD78_06235 [Treponema sp.]|nr:hypothetical protein [Treponema sp.]
MHNKNAVYNKNATKKKFKFFPLLILLMSAILLPAPLAAAGKKDTSPQNKNIPVTQVTGTVRLVGNEPFTQLVISANDKQWYIDSADESKLREFQHRIVTVEGTQTITEMTFANGRPAGTRYTLSNIKIIKIQ